MADGECQRDADGPNNGELDERVYRYADQQNLQDDDYRNVYQIDCKCIIRQRLRDRALRVEPFLEEREQGDRRAHAH